MAMLLTRFERVILLCAAFICIISLYGSEAAGDRQAYMKRIASETAFNDFLQDGKDVKVVYFHGKDIPRRRNFLNEMDKSAGVMQMYNTEFALVDCHKDKVIGYCNVADSESNVYMYRRGRMLLDVSVSTMFDLDSIISNVLQIVLLYDAPILQSSAERDKLEMDNKGSMDVVFSYQKALGTYAHRIMMEVVFAYRSKYRFAITNEQETVQHLPGYSENEQSGVWLLRCKEVRSKTEPCSAVKYSGIVDRERLAQFIHVLTLPPIVYADNNGAPPIYDENHLHTIYLYYSTSMEMSAKNIATEIVDIFLSQLGVIMVNVEKVTNAVELGYTGGLELPALAFKQHGQEMRHFMDMSDVPVRFIAEHISPPTLEDREMVENMENIDGIGMSPRGMNTISESVQPGSEPEKQDDEVAEAAAQLRKTNVADAMRNIVQLTSKTFYTVTSATERNAGPLMVLFYVTFDARCETFLSTYSEAAKQLIEMNGVESLAAINCYDWMDVCQAVNISSYPTLRIYHSDGEAVEYSGFLSQSAIVNTMKLWKLDSPMQLTHLTELEEFISTNNEPRDVDNIPRVFGGFSVSGGQAFETFQAAAKSLKGNLLFSVATGNIASTGCERFNTQPPCIVVIRNHDTVAPFSIVSLSQEDSTKTLVDAIERAKLPLLPELTEENFADLHSLRRPFVIAFINTEQVAAAGRHGYLLPTMTSLITKRTGLSGNVIYGWMDVSQHDLPGSRILRHHVDDPQPEELLCIDLVKNAVYQFPADKPVTVDAVHTWLAAILSESLVASKSLSMEEWSPRKEPYDFLSMMDQEELMGHETNSRVDEYLRRANEDGLGPDDLSATPTSTNDPMLDDVLSEDVVVAVETEMKRMEKSRLYAGSQTKPAVDSEPGMTAGTGKESMEEGKMSGRKQTNAKMHTEL